MGQASMCLLTVPQLPLLAPSFRHRNHYDLPLLVDLVMLDIWASATMTILSRFEPLE